MANKEAQARIKINKFLEDAEWRFFDDAKGRANISLERHVKLTKKVLEEQGEDFEKAKNGYVDYLLLDDNSVPLAVLEAKSETKDPLTGKEQAREYAQSVSVKHIFLSNGNIHYYWNLENGNPTRISKFPSYKELYTTVKYTPEPKKLYKAVIDEDYIALSQDNKWKSYSKEEKQRIRENKDIRILRDYQLAGIQELQYAYKKGTRRFLFEMATGTGKTLLSAAIIKLFIRSNNANRVLFLVDRIELEEQAYKNFQTYLKNDGIVSMIYKRNKSDWKSAHIVITTIQSFAINNRYLDFFPDDFQLIISDEAHRTISGNNRSIFEYFTGAKLGLTATPKDFLKGVDMDDLKTSSPQQYEKRLLLDTYKTFGCEKGIPTFRFSLEDAVKHDPPYLCMPKLIDVRTEITTDLLSKQGWAVKFQNEDGNEETDTYYKKDFMKKFYSEATNLSFVKCFVQNAKRDPISGEIGKTIIFGVSRNHCTILVSLLNEEAHRLFPGKYNSDFAVQITSDISGSSDKTKEFTHDRNCLTGYSRFAPQLEDYKTSKSRICVTVGMMTTGYDCTDVLNIVLARPIFSVSDYIQIKGRGTRLHQFEYKDRKEKFQFKKDNYYMFDFFGNHKYFEDEFDYKDKIELPLEGEKSEGQNIPRSPELIYDGPDKEKSKEVEEFGKDHIMRVDKESFSKAWEAKTREEVYKYPELVKAIEDENFPVIKAFIETNILNRPNEYWTIEKLRAAYNADRKLSFEEMVLKALGVIKQFQSENEVLEESFQKFLNSIAIDGSKYNEIEILYHSYYLYEDIRTIIDEKKDFAKLATDPRLGIEVLKKIGKDTIEQVTTYIRENVFNTKHLTA